MAEAVAVDALTVKLLELLQTVVELVELEQQVRLELLTLVVEAVAVVKYQLLSTLVELEVLA
jgi:hypothetical protein